MSDSLTERMRKAGVAMCRNHPEMCGGCSECEANVARFLLLGVDVTRVEADSEEAHGG